MAEAAPQLEYAPPLPLRRRRSFRRALLGSALLVLLACCWVMLPRYWRNAQEAVQHRQWMRYTRPPTQIAVEPSGAKAQALWESGTYSMRPGYVFHDTNLGRSVEGSDRC